MPNRTDRATTTEELGNRSRYYRTLEQEHLRIQGHKKFYKALEGMQKDQDGYLVRYNSPRPRQGLNMKGITPAQAFRGGTNQRLQTRDLEGRITDHHPWRGDCQAIVGTVHPA